MSRYGDYIEEKVCPYCNRAYFSTDKNQVYCSTHCRNANAWKLQKEKQARDKELKKHPPATFYANIPISKDNPFKDDRLRAIMYENKDTLSYKEIILRNGGYSHEKRVDHRSAYALEESS